MKSDNGVTLISLIAIIVVMLILVTAVTYNGMDEIKDAQKKNFVTDLKMIREKVDLYADKGSETYSNIGKTITDPDTRLTEEELNRLKKIIKLTDITRYKYMDEEEYKKMGLEAIDEITIISFETREVISVEGINIDNQSYYTLAQLDSEKYMPEYKENNDSDDDNNNPGGLPVEEPPHEVNQEGDAELRLTAMQNILVIRPEFKNDSMNYEYYEYYWKKISGTAETQYHIRKTSDPEYMIELEYGEKYEVYVLAYTASGTTKKSNVATVVVK